MCEGLVVKLLRRKGVSRGAIFAAVVVIVIIFAAALLMGGRRRPSKPTTQAQGITLRVITRHGYDILDVAKKEFLASDLAKEYHIVNVEWLSVDPGEWIDIIKASANKPGKEIDVAWGGGPTLFNLLADKGYLAPMTSQKVLLASKDIPDKLAGAMMKRFDSQGRPVWVAAAISSFGFTINKKYLQKAGLPVPERWIDLANETYAKTLPIPSIGTADAMYSTSNTRMFEIILQDYGWEKGWEILTLIGANARIYDKSGLVRDAVIRGDIGAGTTIDFYGYTAQLENPQVCRYLVPKDGSIVNGDPIALLKTSKHQEAAQAFIAWVLSPEGQKIWLNPKVNRMPANPKVFETPEGKKRSDLKAAYEHTLSLISIEFSDALASSYEFSLIQFYHWTIYVPHDKLQQAWEALAKAKLEGKISEQKFEELIDMLANPTKLQFKDPRTGEIKTFTQSYAQSINSLLFNNVDFRKKITDEWYKAAVKRYEEALKILGS